MGYSISVQARDKKLRDRAAKFFERAYRPWYEVWNAPGNNAYSSPPGDPAYKPKKVKNLIGIDYNSGLSGYERTYAYTLMQWLALKIGVEKDIPEVGTVPYLIYDCGDEDIPVLVQALKDTPEHLQWSCVDALGVPLRPTKDHLYTEDFIDMAPLRSEMERLNLLWDAEE